jgi:hypothetical protein
MLKTGKLNKVEISLVGHSLSPQSPSFNSTVLITQPTQLWFAFSLTLADRCQSSAAKSIS